MSFPIALGSLRSKSDVLSANSELLANGNNLSGPEIVGPVGIESHRMGDDSLEHLERPDAEVSVATFERIHERLNGCWTAFDQFFHGRVGRLGHFQRLDDSSQLILFRYLLGGP